MPVRSETVPVRSDAEIVQVRQLVRRWAEELRFSLVDQTKLITAASEIARNTVIYGRGGELILEELNQGGRPGLRLTFQDNGPGISDIEKAMKDGYTTGNGLGLGLSGSKRLVNEFYIDSKPGEGTRIVLIRWK